MEPQTQHKKFRKREIWRPFYHQGTCLKLKDLTCPVKMKRGARGPHLQSQNRPIGSEICWSGVFLTSGMICGRSVRFLDARLISGASEWFLKRFFNLPIDWFLEWFLDHLHSDAHRRARASFSVSWCVATVAPHNMEIGKTSMMRMQFVFFISAVSPCSFLKSVFLVEAK